MLHAALFDALRLEPRERIARFNRVARHLADRNWGGGTRVKKLRGCPWPVFEARLDAGDRVLFTLSHSASPEADDSFLPSLRIWDVVSHDRVNARAARLNLSAEAEFLDLEAVESEEISGPPSVLVARFSELPSSGPGGEPGVLDLLTLPEGQAVPAREEAGAGIRWYVLPDRLLASEEEWQQLADRGTEELELKLSADQYAIVRAAGPVLLSGTAGSGKTTIAVHRLAAACRPAEPARALYVTYSGWLLDHARKLYASLLAARGESPGTRPAFLTVEELYRKLAGPAAEGLALAGFAEFAAWYRSKFRRADAALAWEELRSILKGACLDPARPMLTRAEYEALGRKRAPLFVGERPRLFDVARGWQERIEARSRLDEIDLCRRALGSVLHLPDRLRYDHVICDEAQDLAEIQVDLLLRLHRAGRFENLFLGGDPQQVINPSGFRWAEVRSLLLRRSHGGSRNAPPLRRLTRNFRSASGIVELANEVLAFKRRRTGRSDDDEAEQALVAGALPLRVEGEEGDLCAAIVGFGPRCAVLAGSEEERSRLQGLLATARIFTVTEAKGLEFDVVVLWGILAAKPEVFRALLDSSMDLREDPACRRALHHLYVAVTRARRHLAVWEPPGAPPLWNSGAFARCLEPESPSSLTRLFVRTASPEEWLADGRYFEERGRFRQAAECYRRGGDGWREALAMASHHEAAGDPERAAGEWERLGLRERAARCLEEAEHHERAAVLWEDLGEAHSAGRCRARAAEARRDWAAAAAGWERIGAWSQAARAWDAAGVRQRALCCLAEEASSDGRPADSARRWEEAGMWERAAEAWRAAGRQGESERAGAEAHEAAGRFSEAAAAWKRLGDERRALLCRARRAQKEQDWAEAAEAWETLEDHESAMRFWRKAGRAEDAARCERRADLVAGRFVKVAEELEQQGDLAAAATVWASAHGAGQPPVRRAPLPLPEAARMRWTEGARLPKTARTAKSSVHAVLLPPPHAGMNQGESASYMQWRRAQLKKARRADEAAAAQRSRHDARTRGLACAVTAAEAEGRWEEAAGYWTELGEKDQALRCLVAMDAQAGRFAEAAERMEARKFLPGAARLWRQAGNEPAALRCEALHAQRHRNWAEAERLWRLGGEERKADLARGRWLVDCGEYEQAIPFLERGGELPLPLDFAKERVLQARGDWRGAVRLAEERGDKEWAAYLRRHRREWLVEGRREAQRRRLLQHGAPPKAPKSAGGAVQAHLFPGQGAPDQGAAARAGTIPPEEPGPPPHLGPLVAVVRDSPGLTAAELAGVLRTTPGRLRARLAEAVGAGFVRKHGRTRGTSYWPVD